MTSRNDDGERAGVDGQTRDSLFEALVTLHGPDITRYIQRRRYPIVAEDVNDLVGEVFTVLWRRMESLPDEGRLPWLLGIARNVLSSAKRSQRRRSNYEKTIWNPTLEPSAEDEIVASETIRLALSQMKPRDREILILHYWDGLDAVGLAHSLSLSSHAASVRLSRASQRFQENFNGLEKK
jgi:RNA polymerase sigma factor (sigma-70 family)